MPSVPQVERILITVDAGELAALREEIRALREEMRALTIAQRPEWVPVTEYARHAGVTPRTVRNRIASGELETYRHGKTTMIRANQIRRK